MYMCMSAGICEHRCVRAQMCVCTFVSTGVYM